MLATSSTGRRHSSDLAVSDIRQCLQPLMTGMGQGSTLLQTVVRDRVPPKVFESTWV